MDQTHQEFLLELEGLVEHVFNDLDELRLADSNRSQQRKLISSIFRRVHSIKGLSAAAGLDDVSKTAHEFENLLAALRFGQAGLDDELLDLCDNATDALFEGLHLQTPERMQSSPDQTLSDQLRAAVAVAQSAGAGNAEPELPAGVGDRLTDGEKQRLQVLLKEGNALIQVIAGFALNTFDREFTVFREKLSETGEVISTSPGIDENHPDQMRFTLLYAAPPQSSFRNVLADLGGCSFEELIAASDEFPDGTSSLPLYIRTDLEKLDHLIFSTHELFRTTTNALEERLRAGGVSEDERTQMCAQNEQIRNSFLSVEEELINLRMVSLGPILQRAARAGRAAARSAGRRIRVEVTGVAVTVDKVVADVIADPLIHLVRNAVDHGIESSDERSRAGKAARGAIRIEAINEGSQSRIRVTDDGRGINPGDVSAAARALGLAEQNSMLDLERSLRMIFRPGFTTASEVTDLSGRGVGLDVVETAVEQVGGGLRVSSKPGEGSTFEIVLPVSFGLVRVTVVSSSGNRYCIPSQYVGNGSAVISTAVSLRKLLGTVSVESGGTQVTCQMPEGRVVRINVDAVIGEEEVLVRNLGRYAGRWQGVAGAAELRDGSVALLLDLPRLLAQEA